MTIWLQTSEQLTNNFAVSPIEPRKEGEQQGSDTKAYLGVQMHLAPNEINHPALHAVPHRNSQMQIQAQILAPECMTKPTPKKAETQAEAELKEAAKLVTKSTQSLEDRK